jgi:amidase
MTFDLEVAGPLARDARDLAFALSTLGGPVADEALAWSWRMPPPRQKRLRDFRIGYLTGERIAGREPPFIPGRLPASRHDPIAADVLEVYENVLATLARSGVTLERGWPEGIQSTAQHETFFYLGLSRAQSTKEELEQFQRRMRENPDDIRAAARAAPHSRWLIETERQFEFRAAWQGYFKTHDVFLLPAAATAAFPHDNSEPFWQRRIDTPDGKVNGDEFNYWNVFASLPGLPATVAPVGRTRGGLPVGIQIIAPMWEDGTSIEFAALLADLVGGFTPPPGYGL